MEDARRKKDQMMRGGKKFGRCEDEERSEDARRKNDQEMKVGRKIGRCED